MLVNKEYIANISFLTALINLLLDVPLQSYKLCTLPRPNKTMSMCGLSYNHWDEELSISRHYIIEGATVCLVNVLQLAHTILQHVLCALLTAVIHEIIDP